VFKVAGHWNPITLDGSLPDQLVRDMVEDSYDLIVSALSRRVRGQPGIDDRRYSP
jgi:predicted DNA-binding protein (MmcQ/YjbR family)